MRMERALEYPHWGLEHLNSRLDATTLELYAVETFLKLLIFKYLLCAKG